MKEMSNSKALKSVTLNKMLDQRGDAQSVQSPVKRGPQRMRVNATSKHSDSKSKSSMYCHKDKVRQSGIFMKIRVGKRFIICVPVKLDVTI